MSKASKIVLVFATVLPVPAMAAVVYAFFTTTKIRGFIPAGGPSAAPPFPFWAFGLIATVLWCFVVYFIYVSHIVANMRISMNGKAGWILTMLLGHALMPLNLLVMLFYWRRYVWNAPRLTVVERYQEG